MRTLVLTFNKDVQDQWADEFEQETGTRPARLTNWLKRKKRGDIPIFLVEGTLSFQKLDRELIDSLGIGTVIIDEAHLTTDAINECLLRIEPRYLIGLSATSDKRQDILSIHFEKNFIFGTEHKEFIVYKVKTLSNL